MSDFQLEWRGPQVSTAVKEDGAEGLQEALQRLLAASNRRVPVDSGELRASGSVSGSGLQGSVSYSADHAVIVHESLERNYRRGEAKFLERALVEEKDQLLEAIAAALKAALK